MWPLIMGFARTYAVYITFPVAVVVGFVGYNVEGALRKGQVQQHKKRSIHEERDEREWQDMKDKDPSQVTLLKSKVDIPTTVLAPHNRTDAN